VPAVLPGAASAAEICPNAAFRTGPSAALPDCRAYEMVSPPFKGGYTVELRAISEDGSRVVSQSLGTFAGTEGVPGTFEDDILDLGTSYVFTRGTSGWVTTPIGLPGTRFPEAGEDTLKSSNLGRSLWLASTQPSPSRHTNEILPDLEFGGPEGSIEEIGSVFPPGTTVAEAAEEGFVIEGASSDLSHVFFSLSNFYWPGDATEPGNHSLYEYVGAGGAEPLLVGVSGGAGSTSLIGDCGTRLVANENPGKHPVSADGTTVFFRVKACAGSPPIGELFARVDNEQPDAHTVAISEPLVKLLNPLMAIIVLPYLGPATAERERARQAPRARRRPVNGQGDPLRNLDMRLTYRTVRVLLAVAELGGRESDPSSREVADASGVSDQGQMSKLLWRLEHLGLIANDPPRPARGEPNAWALTAKGHEVEQAIRAQTTH